MASPGVAVDNAAVLSPSLFAAEITAKVCL